YQLTAYRKEYLKPFLSLPDVILAHSHYMERLFQQYGGGLKNIRVLRMGVPSARPDVRHAPREAATPRFIFLGNISPIKGLDTLVHAFRSLRHRAELHIYGKVSDSAYANKVFAEAKGHDHIVYKGAYRPETLPEILAGADCLVLPSLNE